VADALGRIGDTRALEPLLGVLKNGAKKAREAGWHVHGFAWTCEARSGGVALEAAGMILPLDGTPSSALPGCGEGRLIDKVRAWAGGHGKAAVAGNGKEQVAVSASAAYLVRWWPPNNKMQPTRRTALVQELVSTAPGG
jgi:hypothetical protein